MDRDDLFGRDRGWGGDDRYGWERQRREREMRNEYGYRRDRYDASGRDHYGRDDYPQDDWYDPRQYEGPAGWEDRRRHEARPRHHEGLGERMHAFSERMQGRFRDWRHHGGRPEHHELRGDEVQPWSDEYRRREERRWQQEEWGPGQWLKQVVEGFDHGGRDESRQMRERFGRGPKNYRRSDSRIQEDVCERVADHPWVDASDVEIQVKNAEVTLVGTVPSRMDKRAVEDCAHSVRGVDDVHNQLRIAQPESGTETRPKRTNGSRGDAHM